MDNISNKMCNKCGDKFREAEALCKTYEDLVADEDNKLCEIEDQESEQASEQQEICYESEELLEIAFFEYENFCKKLEYCPRCKAAIISSNKDVIIKEIERFLLTNEHEKTDTDYKFYRLIDGSVDVPYNGKTPIKALFLAESEENWEFPNIKSVGITNKNIRSFATSDEQLGVCTTLSGVNMAYVTHIIVTDVSFYPDIEQFIGRAQRPLKRTSNLKVLMIN